MNRSAPMKTPSIDPQAGHVTGILTSDFCFSLKSVLPFNATYPLFSGLLGEASSNSLLLLYLLNPVGGYKYL